MSRQALTPAQKRALLAMPADNSPPRETIPTAVLRQLHLAGLVDWADPPGWHLCLTPAGIEARAKIEGTE